MRILISGASGLVGSALTPFLEARGHEVLRLVRHVPSSDAEIFWNPVAGKFDASAIEGIDAVVNLAGETIAGGRWTTARRERILRSRVDATRTLVTALGQLARKPSVLVSASAAGFYGDRGDEELTEGSDIGRGFLAGVCLAWETHAEGAARLGIRTVLMRFGMVLSAQGGALAKMAPVFRAGLGGRLGDGRQWMSWIALDDAVGAIQHALTNESCTGPLNAVAPEPVRNAEFAAMLGRTLRRPVFLPVPTFALRLAFGQMADDALLASTRALPQKLAQTGYGFRYPRLEAALAHALSPRKL